MVMPNDYVFPEMTRNANVKCVEHASLVSSNMRAFSTNLTTHVIAVNLAIRMI